MHSGDRFQFLEARLSGEMKRSEPDPNSVASGFYAVTHPAESAAELERSSPSPQAVPHSSSSGGAFSSAADSWTSDSPPPTSISKKRKTHQAGGAEAAPDSGGVRDLQQLDFRGAFDPALQAQHSRSPQNTSAQQQQQAAAQQQAQQAQQAQQTQRLQAVQAELEEMKQTKQRLEAEVQQRQEDAKRRSHDADRWKQHYENATKEHGTPAPHTAPLRSRCLRAVSPAHFPG